MVNAKKMIQKKQQYMKKLDKEEAKRGLEVIRFSTNISEVESLYPLLATILDKNGFKDRELLDKIDDILNLNSFKKLLNIEISKILQNTMFEKDKGYISEYIEKTIYPYYKSSFSINKSREISFLPLDLRLYLYNSLLKLENNMFICLNYLDRINITLAEMGYGELASIVSAYNWVLNWGQLIGESANSIFESDILFISEATQCRSEILDEKKQYIDEFLNCISFFTDIYLIKDEEIAKKLLPLVKIYFKNIPYIDTYINNINIYLETGNEDIAKDIYNIKQNIEIKYKTYSSNYNNIKSLNITESQKLKMLENIRSYVDEKKLNANSQWKLGCKFYNGEGTKKDLRRAFQWIERAAKQNHVDAQWHLGCMLYNGDGIKKDFKKAFEWYRKAAEQGHASAQFNLATMYFSGQGIERDVEKCIELLQIAAKQGNVYARRALMSMVRRS